MPTGTVKWFNNQKGYGFISQVGGPDVFAHYTAIAGEGFRTLKEGEEVEFEITEGPKGPQAANIRRKGMSTGPAEAEGEVIGETSVEEAGSDAADTVTDDAPTEETTEEDLQ
jgi:CspA family cold shock protein